MTNVIEKSLIDRLGNKKKKNGNCLDKRAFTQALECFFKTTKGRTLVNKLTRKGARKFDRNILEKQNRQNPVSSHHGGGGGGGECTPYNGLYKKTPPEKGYFLHS